MEDIDYVETNLICCTADTTHAEFDIILVMFLMEIFLYFRFHYMWQQRWRQSGDLHSLFRQQTAMQKQV